MKCTCTHIGHGSEFILIPSKISAVSLIQIINTLSPMYKGKSEEGLNLSFYKYM